jgi:DNA-binding response OmpR family regulator
MDADGQGGILPPGPMPSILLIDDDTRLTAMVADYLRAQQLDVAHAPDAAAGLALLQARGFDLVLLDLMLPDGDGLDLFRAIRAQPSLQSVPVIMLTARGDPMDKVVGLEIGAEDYVAKPFEPRELLARIRVVLRRAANPSLVADMMRFGRLEIDRGSRAVRLDGEEKPLTSYQFDLLLAMAERAGRVQTREGLADLVRSDQQPYDPALDRSIDVHIARLRAAIEDDPKKPRRILTVRGVGYVFAKAQS